MTTVIEEAKRVVRDKQLNVQFSILQPFYDQPEYLDALAASVRDYVEQDYDHLLLSFHGLPERHLTKLDPTGQHCFKDADCCKNASPRCLPLVIARSASAWRGTWPSGWVCRR